MNEPLPIFPQEKKIITNFNPQKIILTTNNIFIIHELNFISLFYQKKKKIRKFPHNTRKQYSKIRNNVFMKHLYIYPGWGFINKIEQHRPIKIQYYNIRVASRKWLLRRGTRFAIISSRRPTVEDATSEVYLRHSKHPGIIISM